MTVMLDLATPHAMKNVRNFCIIAHIDHGKSTLADRLIQVCGAVEAREFRDQVLDDMELERERGITIKSNSVSLSYQAKNGETYQLNLIDTPGHVDFSHEVRRSLMACDGAVIIVDAAQGVEAQTVANLYLALEHELELLPIINKIDLPAADIDTAREEIDRDLGLDPFLAIPISAKKGIGIEEVLEGIVEHLPPPAGDPKASLKALVFDAQYDHYRGIVLSCRVIDGVLRDGERVRFMHTGREYEVHEVGYNRLRRAKVEVLPTGAVGYVITGIKTIRDVSIGDTLTLAGQPTDEPLPGYQPAKPVVFSSIYPMSTDEYGDLGAAIEKLALNDAALIYQKDSSAALGFGFRCGFLGLLHLDIVQERLKRGFESLVDSHRPIGASTVSLATMAASRRSTTPAIGPTRRKSPRSRSHISRPKFWCRKVTWAPLSRCAATTEPRPSTPATWRRAVWN